ncbi:MAG: right-handed parallel beta-helix repeat-containing protein [Nannocystaceae bacterium]|nr:right-handed parallel beta-helix repeat-containing protein [Nannocystaceae bacterium]
MAAPRDPLGLGTLASAAGESGDGGADEGDGGGTGASAAADGSTTASLDDAGEGSSAAADDGAVGSDTAGSDGGPPPQGTVDAGAFASIQDAIDSLEGIGGAVYVPAGQWSVPEKLRVHSGITLFGAGMDVTVIRLADGAPDDDLLSNDSSSGLQDIVVRDLTLQGRGAGAGDCRHGLKLAKVERVTVIAVAARDHCADGFYLGYKHVDGVPIGVADIRLSGIVATGNGRNGLSLVQGHDVLVDGGSFSGNNVGELVSAIDLEPDPYPDGNVSGNRIIGNTISDNANNGLQLWADGGAIVADNVACNNTITGNAGTGISDHQADDDVFVGNVLAGNGAQADYDGSAHVGDAFAEACGLPLPGLPPPPPLP